MPYCHSCTSRVTPRELHDFSSNRKAVRPECPICLELGSLERRDRGGMKAYAG